MSGKLIELEAARRLVLHRSAPLGTEEVALADALGRVLGTDVTSAEQVPGFDNSAMDGFAVRAADTSGASPASPTRLAVTDESRAGRPAALPVGEGEAVAISTGAMLPAGADAVIPVEDTEGRDGAIELRAAVDAGRYVRCAGDDIRVGDAVLRAGTPIGAAELGVLASVGATAVSCARRPRVSVLISGDELVEPGEALGPGQIRDTNAFTVPALARSCGAQVVGSEKVGDDASATREALERALDADLAVISGGMSVGEHDHVRPALAELGAEEVFWGVALRPGKPTWFGIHSGALVFGLPGNPVSAVVCFILLVRPAIMAMLGAPPDRHRSRAVLDSDYSKQPGRMHAVRCRLEIRDDGWHARPTKEQGSHILTSMVGAEALALIPTESGSLKAGAPVDVELLPRS